MLSQRILLIGGAALAAIMTLLGLIFWLSTQDKAKTPAEPEVVRELITTAYEDQVIEDDNLFTDSSPVRIQVGIPGITEEVYQVTRDETGNILDKKLIETNIQVAKQDRITRKGTLDREATEKKIRAVIASIFDSLETLNFTTLYPLLATVDRMHYTEQQLSNSAKAIALDLDTYSITGEIAYLYPKYLSDKDNSLSPIQDVVSDNTDETNSGATDTGLIAVIPSSMTFNSDVIGTQGIGFDLRLVHENGDWFIRYFGPTEVLPIDQTRTQADGGKVFGKPIGARVTVNRAVFFPFLNRLYFDYTLVNTSERNYTEPLREDEEPIFVPTDAFISKVTLYDEPATPYVLQENILFNQSDDTVWVGKSAVGRLIYSPTPGLEIARLYLSMQLTINDAASFTTEAMSEREVTAFVVDVDFGEIVLKRQNRQADYGRENAIREDTQRRAIEEEETAAPLSTPQAAP